ncbi:MAG: hypothetical protein AAGG38_12170, partial [Planctomycetota bacterium]
RHATVLRRGQTHTLADHAPPPPPAIAPADRFLFTVDPAVERARLLHRIPLPLVHPQLGLFTGPQPLDHPFLTPFRLLAELPFHPQNPRKLKAWLRDHDAGLVEIKTRGKAVNPDPLQTQLRGPGQTPYTLFILRWDRALRAHITQRL